MQIKIAERLRPFSHTPGTKSVLPNSALIVQVFPAKLLFFDDKNHLLAEVALKFEGPLKQFTVQTDLEKGEIKVWGRAKRGFLRYRIVAIQEALCALLLEKRPEDFSWTSSSDQLALDPKTYTPIKCESVERLSLGSHKAQDVDAMRRRLDLVEIFPFWLRLGQMVPRCTQGEGGTLSFLKKAKDISTYQNLFLAGFSGIFAPRTTDEEHWGFPLPKVKGSPSSFPLLTEAGIRSLFVQVKGFSITLLPKLPPEFHCGRYLNIRLGELGTLDMEWSKKRLRRVVLRAACKASIQLHVPKGIKTCRIRTSPNDRGKKIPCPIQLETEAHKTYDLDRFER